MQILFVHQNLPGQYLHLARYLGAQPGNETVFITQRKDAMVLNVKRAGGKTAPVAGELDARPFSCGHLQNQSRCQRRCRLQISI